MLSLFRRASEELAHAPKGHVPALDVLRTTAIGLVVLGHVAEPFDASLLLHKLPLIHFGWTGVDLFFILSGFLIGSTLWRELKTSGRIDVPAFIIRRGLRIWPYYYAVILFSIVLSLLAGRALNGFLPDIFFLSNYILQNRVAGGWSLSTEEQFYILSPIALIIGVRYLSPRALVWLPIAWVVAMPLFRWATTHFVDVSAHKLPFFLNFHTHSDGLAVGMILGWIAVFRPEWMRKGRNDLVALLGLVAVAVALRAVHAQIFGFAAVALIFGGMTFYLLRKPATPQWMASNAFHVCSRLSFGVYLNHFFVLEALSPWMKSVSGSTVGFVYFAILTVVLCLIVAFVTFALIELPGLNLRSRVLAQRASRAGAGPVGHG